MASDNSALQRRALAALILAESERGAAGYGTRLPTERQPAAGQAPDAADDEVPRASAPAEPASAGDGLPALSALSGAADYAPADVMAVRRLFEPTAMSLVVA